MKALTGLSILIIFFFVSCGKEDNSLIPDVPVSFSVPVNDPRISGLTTVAGKIIILDGYGYAGLILYSRSDKVIVAYDRCSTVNPEKKNKLDILTGNIVVDKASGAYFNLEDGSAAKAPATRSLKRYGVSNNGSTISVYN